MTDMEGISGIREQTMVQPAQPKYQGGRKLLMGDVNAAIAGAFDGGAEYVLVNDGHGGGPHFILEEMDPRAEYERPNSGANYLPGLDESFAGVFIVGIHAMAGTLNGFLDHTQSSASWYNYYINGRKCGETGQVAAGAGHYDVPVVLVTGDQAAAEEAREFCGEVETVAVKQGIGRQWARCLHPQVARKQIREAAQRAMDLVDKIKPYKIDLPATIKLELYRSDMADGYAHHEGVERIDARAIQKVVPTALDILNL